MSLSSNFLIVGAKFRPPAVALLDTLKIGTTLAARREPSNAYDPNAIMVLVRSSDIEVTDAMRLQVANYGKSEDELKAAPEWHLGYVPREHAAALAPLMDRDGIVEIIGSLIFTAAGLPSIHMEVPDGK